MQLTKRQQQIFDLWRLFLISSRFRMEISVYHELA